MLQVWMPLIDSVNNLGLTNATVTGYSSATYGGNGKIGSTCLNSSSTMTINLGKSPGKVWSVCFWGYVHSSQITSDWTKIISMSDGSSSLRVEVCVLNKYNGNPYSYSIYNNTGYMITNQGIPSTNGTSYYDSWVHFCLTSDGTTLTRYMNGELIGTCSYNGSGQLTGQIDLWFNDKINKNDFRFYDNCLSTKEVKEISKGLVLHYQLSKTGVENLLRNTYDATNISNQCIWDKNTNVTVDKGVYTFSDVSTLAWNSIGCNSFLSVNEYENKTLTISFEFRADDNNASSGNKYAVIEVCPSLNTTSYRNDVYITYTTNAAKPQWTKFSKTITITKNMFTSGSGTVADWSKRYLSFRLYRYNTKGCQFRNFKIEEGSIATPWMPHKLDELYSQMGYDNNIEYDCSGYNNNGIKVGQGIIESDTPRYSTCLNNNSELYITMPKITLDKSYSISLWIKPNSSMIGWQRIFNLGDNGTNRTGLCCHSNGTVIGYHNYYNGTYIYDNYSFSYVPNVWYYYCIACSGNQIKQYVNGQLIHTGNLSIEYNGMTYSTGNLYRMYNSNNANACLSDFRIYSTALSQEDILELYNTGASIDDHGTAYAYEVVE